MLIYVAFLDNAIAKLELAIYKQGYTATPI